MRTLRDIAAYFEGIATRSPEFNSFQEGDLEEILDRQSTDIAYPTLWMETPDVRLISDEENSFVRMEVTVVLLDLSKERTYAELREEMSHLLDVAVQLVLRVREDAKEASDWHLIVSNQEDVPITPKMVGLDIDFGWAVSFVFELATPCLDRTMFPDAP